MWDLFKECTSFELQRLIRPFHLLSHIFKSVSDNFNQELCSNNYRTEPCWTLTRYLFYLQLERAPHCQDLHKEWELVLGFAQSESDSKPGRCCEGCIYKTREGTSPNELRVLTHHIKPNLSRSELPSDLLHVFSSGLTASWGPRLMRLPSCVSMSLTSGCVLTDVSTAGKKRKESALSPLLISMQLLCW